VAGGVAGGEDRLDLEVAGAELAAVLERLGDLELDLGGGLGMGDDRRRGRRRDRRGGG
jgi:hypothetical protein